MGKENIKFFEKQIKQIGNKNLRTIVVHILNMVGDENSMRPSSSTGKYHSAADNGPNGNGIHCLNVTYCTMRLIQCIPEYDSQINQDIMRISAMLHDMLKYKSPEAKYTNFMHPVRMANLVRSYKEDYPECENHLEQIARNIETHMSRWRESQFSKEQLPIIRTRSQYIIAFADLIASDKNIHIDENSL